MADSVGSLSWPCNVLTTAKNSLHGQGIEPFEPQDLAVADVMPAGNPGRELEHIVRPGVRRIVGTGVGLARRDIMRNMDHALLLVDPDHVERNQRVLHPEGILTHCRED